MIQIDIWSFPKGFKYLNTTGNDFGDFPGGITIGLQNYASNNADCINASMTEFLQHVPFILLGKAEILNGNFFFILAF